jgi:hypothetical protein
MSRGPSDADREPIEDYLDDLLLELRLPPRETRWLLAETEAHLRDAAAAGESAGLSRSDAERAAVRRFGSPADVAATASAARRTAPLERAATLLWSALVLGGAGLAAVGLSGLLAGVANVTLGPRFVGALPETYSAATCSYYVAVHPGASDCTQAAMWENSQDAVVLRVLAGVVGALLLLAAWASRRYLKSDRSGSAVRDGLVGAAAAVSFAVAAAMLGGYAVDVAVQHGSGGVGFYLTGALAAAGAAVMGAVIAFRRLRHVRPWQFGVEALP